MVCVGPRAESDTLRYRAAAEEGGSREIEKKREIKKSAVTSCRGHGKTRRAGPDRGGETRTGQRSLGPCLRGGPLEGVL